MLKVGKGLLRFFPKYLEYNLMLESLYACNVQRVTELEIHRLEKLGIEVPDNSFKYEPISNKNNFIEYWFMPKFFYTCIKYESNLRTIVYILMNDIPIKGIWDVIASHDHRFVIIRFSRKSDALVFKMMY